MRAICRKRQNGGSVELRDALYCYFFLLDVRLRREGA